MAQSSVIDRLRFYIISHGNVCLNLGDISYFEFLVNVEYYIQYEPVMLKITAIV